VSLRDRLNPRHLAKALRAARAGAGRPLRITFEAVRAGIPIAAAFALVEKESGRAARNVFGHDPTTSIPSSWMGQRVTRSRYVHYKRWRAARGMQGVGPLQLTWWEFQDRADRLGGCWKPWHSIRVGLEVYAGHYRAASGTRRERLRAAAEKYNGSGPAAVAYGRDFMVKFDAWQRVLNRR
jgi:hypothetical protein